MCPFGWVELFPSIHFLLRISFKRFFLWMIWKMLLNLNVSQWVSLQLVFLWVLNRFQLLQRYAFGFMTLASAHAIKIKNRNLPPFPFLIFVGHGWLLELTVVFRSLHLLCVSNSSTGRSQQHFRRHLSSSWSCVTPDPQKKHSSIPLWLCFSGWTLTDTRGKDVIVWVPLHCLS